MPPTGAVAKLPKEKENSESGKSDDQSGWRGFVSLCASARSEEELSGFLQLFLTIEEREDLRGRYEIVKSLLEGQKSQREIASDLGVSISKITRGSNSLKVIEPRLETLLRRRMNIESG